MEESKGGKRRKVALVGLAILAVLIIADFGLKNLMSGHGGKNKAPPKISLIPSTPPPPPPPPKEEKKPEPPKEQKEVKMDQVEQKAAPPADPALKMEGAAGDGPSAFAAGKVTSEDLSKLGTGSGGLLNPFNVYASSIKGELQRHLSKQNDLRRRTYRIELHVWVTSDGSVKRSELVGSTGDEDTDDAIRRALTSLPAFSEPPPPNMPQPIRLRIVAGGRT